MLWKLTFKKHPDNEFIGLVEKECNFLGYHFTPYGLSVAKTTLDNHFNKATLFYEQIPSAHEGAERVLNYVK